MTYHIVYSGVEMTEWYRRVIPSLHGELIKVDGGFVKPCGSSRLKATKLETSRSQRSRQTNRRGFVHAASWKTVEAFAFTPSQLQPLTWVNLLHRYESPRIGKCLYR